MNYGLNIDVLYNVIASANANFGVFVGVGAGANTWAAKDKKTLRQKQALVPL